MFAIIRTRWQTRPLSRRAKRRSSATPGSLRKKYAGIVHPPNMVRLPNHSTISGDDRKPVLYTGRQDLLFAQHFRAVELGDRGPAQLADLLGHLLGARFELRRVEMPAAQLDLTATVLDIGGVVLGEELDLGRVALEP